MIIARWTSETLFNLRRYCLIPKKLLYKKWLLIVSVTRAATIFYNDIILIDKVTQEKKEMCHLLRINPFHLRKDMLIHTELKSWVYCAATVEISSDTQILVAPQCAITDSLLKARKSGNVHSSALWLQSFSFATAAAAAVNDNDDSDNDSDNDDDDDGDDDDHDDVNDDDDDDDDVEDDDMYDTDNKAGDDAIHLGFSYHTHLSLNPP